MNLEQLKENPRQLVIGGIAAVVLLVAAIWIISGLFGGPTTFTTDSGVSAFIQKARQAVSDPKFADVNIMPDGEGKGVMVSGNLKTGADADEARRLIEAVQPSVPLSFNLNSIDRAPPPPK